LPGGAYGPAIPSARRPLRTVALVVSALLIAAAVGVPTAILVSRTGSNSGSASTGGSSPTPTPVSSSAARAATALYQEALQAAEASAGFHYLGNAPGGQVHETVTGEAGQKDGTQVFDQTTGYGDEKFTLELTSDGTVYFQGNTPALEDQVGVSDSAAPGLDGTWISVVVGDGPYSSLEAGITVSSQLQEDTFIPASTRQVTGSGGATLTEITGTVPPGQNSPGGTAKLEISPTTHLPVSFEENTGIDYVTTFSDWGTAPSVTAPSGAVAWSTLGASEPPGGYGNGTPPSPGATPTPSATPTPTPTPAGSV